MSQITKGTEQISFMPFLVFSLASSLSVSTSLWLSHKFTLSSPPFSPLFITSTCLCTISTPLFSTCLKPSSSPYLSKPKWDPLRRAN